MKAALKVVLFGLLAAALAFGVRWLYRQSADVINGGGSAWYEDKLLEDKELYYPEQVFAEQVNNVENYPTDIPYGDMNNNTTDEKTRLLENWEF